MKAKGQGGTKRIDREGMTCTSVGFVEAIRGLNLRRSKWRITYELDTGGKTIKGSTLSEWKFTDEWMSNSTAVLEDFKDGTALCKRDETSCREIEQEWEGHGPIQLYVVFRPDEVH